MNEPKKISVHAHELADDDVMTRAICVMLWKAIQGGVRSPGESCTIMIPDLLVGPTRESAIQTGEWEIKMTKIGD